MPGKTFTQLTNITEPNIDKDNDLFAVWDNTSPAQAKNLSAKNVLTSPDTNTTLQEGATPVSTTGVVSRVVCVDQTGYNNLSPKDSNTLYVITDGVTLDSYNGQIDTPAANKKYYLDLQAVSDRRIVKFQILYTSGASGAGTITLKVNGGGTPGTNEDTITFDVSQTDQSAGGGVISLAVTAGQEIRLETNGSVADVTNLVFIVEYEV